MERIGRFVGPRPEKYRSMTRWATTGADRQTVARLIALDRHRICFRQTAQPPAKQPAAIRWPRCQCLPRRWASADIDSDVPTQGLPPKYFLKFHTKSRHIEASIPCDANNEATDCGTLAATPSTACFAVQRSSVQ